jgi:hypothetical protein
MAPVKSLLAANTAITAAHKITSKCVLSNLGFIDNSPPAQWQYKSTTDKRVFPKRDKLTLVKGCKITERGGRKENVDPGKWSLSVVKRPAAL